MIIIGEKINGAIPSIKEAIANRDEALIRERVQVQLPAKPDFLDCAPATEPALEYDAMKWLIGIMEEETDTPLCLDSPDPLEGTKCETLFPIIAGTDWNVIGLTCDQDGIPLDPDKKIEIAKRIIDKADKFGVALGNLHIDPCVMSLSTVPNSVEDLCTCIRAIKEYAPEVKVTAAISNVSYGMPARKYVNMACMAKALDAGLDSCIIDPASPSMMGILYAHAAVSGEDKGGRKYNRAYRKKIIR